MAPLVRSPITVCCVDFSIDPAPLSHTPRAFRGDACGGLSLHSPHTMAPPRPLRFCGELSPERRVCAETLSVASPKGMLSPTGECVCRTQCLAGRLRPRRPHASATHSPDVQDSARDRGDAALARTSCVVEPIHQCPFHSWTVGVRSFFVPDPLEDGWPKSSRIFCG